MSTIHVETNGKRKAIFAYEFDQLRTLQCAKRGALDKAYWPPPKPIQGYAVFHILDLPCSQLAPVRLVVVDSSLVLSQLECFLVSVDENFEKSFCIDFLLAAVHPSKFVQHV